MSRRKVKAEVFALLDTCTPAELEMKLSGFPPIGLVNSLFMALCDPNERIKWRAVTSFGLLVSQMANEDLESGRVIMRRFLWTLNDESGGIGWGAPESMAEIMTRSEILRQEYLHMLISYMREDGEELFQDGNYLELPLLQRGLLWGVGTLCKASPGEMIERGVVEDLHSYLHSSDKEVCRLALWSLSHLGVKVMRNSLSQKLPLEDTLRIYVDGSFAEIPLQNIYIKLGVL